MVDFIEANAGSIITLIGVIITCYASSKVTKNDFVHKIEISQAVTNTKIEELTREVRLHNNFAQRVPVVEEQVKVINHRISDLENRSDKK